MSKVKHSNFRHDEIGGRADEFIFNRNGSNGDDIFVGTAANEDQPLRVEQRQPDAGAIAFGSEVGHQ